MATEIEKFTIDNGLRVVLAPDTTTPVVGVSVHYDVGYRSEPVGRTGFAHLFEHLMFQGSESLEKFASIRLITGSGGGTFNGSTHPDYTDYYEVLPSAALERALFYEADRMRAPTLTQENLDNQLDVVKEEIRLNVLNRPYGGFPWIWLPPVLYDTFPNAHNGYGDFVDLEQATLDDCAEFFDTYYSPANAVLTLCGDFEPERARELIEQHFGDVPARPRPERASFAEPWPSDEKRGTRPDAHAPLPALGVGYRLPDPVGELVRGNTLPNGLELRQVRVPFGVVGMIYEARPNVTADVAGLCLKSGNACVLRGSSTALSSNGAIVDVLRHAMGSVGVPEDAVQLVQGTDRESATQLMQATDFVDLLVPRGGKALIESIEEFATVPYIIDGDGNCHVYVDAAADHEMATSIVVNAKVQRP
ncbi:MAG: aldehyde dehydrogenase family protein, partial [Thermocrispum sp.]